MRKNRAYKKMPRLSDDTSLAGRRPKLLELFSGTGSVGRVFAERGWDVYSVDLDPQSGASFTGDVLEWDPTQFRPSDFDCVWASPPCTMYSIARTTAKTPRDLALADSLVRRTQNLIGYFSAGNPNLPWFIENPQTGLLKTRDLMQDVPFVDVTYCKFEGCPGYKKATRIWTNCSAELSERVPGPCSAADPCEHRFQGRHPCTAQRGPARGSETDVHMPLSILHQIPRGLVEAVEETARARREATSA